MDISHELVRKIQWSCVCMRLMMGACVQFAQQYLLTLMGQKDALVCCTL